MASYLLVLENQILFIATEPSYGGGFHINAKKIDSWNEMLTINLMIIT